MIDSEYQSGRFGFIINTLDETYAHIHFDSVAVWQLSESVAPTEGLENSEVQPVSESLCRGSVVEGNTLVNFITHTVISEDTISSIAQQYALTTDEIYAANGRIVEDPNLITPGQVLIIPQN